MEGASTDGSRERSWTIEKALTANSIDYPKGSASPIPFFHLLERLKTTERQGWKRFGIKKGESIADHSHRMALMTMFAPPSLRQSLDLAKCIKMALIHDVAESVVGDLTPADGVPKAEKNRRESLTMDFLAQDLLGKVHGGTSGEEMRALWQEFEDSATQESLFVQDIDKVELLLQMVEYEKREKVDLSEFTYVASKIRLPGLKLWADQIFEERGNILIARKSNAVSSAMKDLQDQYYGN